MANSPITSPPRTLTAPISVIESVPVLPVVSRSTTTNVVACSGWASSSRLSCSWRSRTGGEPGAGMAVEALLPITLCDASRAV